MSDNYEIHNMKMNIQQLQSQLFEQMNHIRALRVKSSQQDAHIRQLELDIQKIYSSQKQD